MEHRSRMRVTIDTILKNRLAVAGLVVLAVLILAAIFGPLIAPYGINDINIADRLQGLSSAHWFGTDDLGRDVFSRVLIGARVSLLVGFIAVGIAVAIGVPIGLASGFYGGATDSWLMRFMDILFSLPAILLAIAILAVLGPGIVKRDDRHRHRLHADLRQDHARLSSRREGIGVRPAPPDRLAPPTLESCEATSCPTLWRRSSCRPA